MDRARQLRCSGRLLPPRAGSLELHRFLQDLQLTYKRNAFPIAGDPEPDSDDPRELRRKEKPLIQETIPLAPFRADTNLPLPADRNLCGTTWHTQVVMLDPGASAGLSFAPGLTLNLGW